MGPRSNQQLHDDGVQLAIEELRFGGIEVGHRSKVERIGDLAVVRREDGFVVGIRIRRLRYLGRHRHDVTLRMSSRTSKIETDLIRVGRWCDVYFYAFVDECEKVLRDFLAYHCLDVRVWRERPALISENYRGNKVHRNPVDGALFLSIDLRYQPPGLVRFTSLKVIEDRRGFLKEVA